MPSYDGYQYKAGTIKKLLWRHGGIIKNAAAELGISRQKFSAFVDKYDLWEEADNAVNDTLDTAEAELKKHIEKGNLSAIMFYLKCKGKGRGYIERPLPERKKDDIPQQVNIIIGNPNEKKEGLPSPNNTIRPTLPAIRSVELLNEPSDN